MFSYSPHGRHAIVPATSVVPLGKLADPELGVFFANVNTRLQWRSWTPICRSVPMWSFPAFGVIGQIVTRLLKLGLEHAPSSPSTAWGRAEVSGAMAGGATHILNPDSDKVAERVRELTEGRERMRSSEVSGAAPALNEMPSAPAGYNGTVIAMSW